MYPHDLEPSKLALPPGPRTPAILITGGTSERYLRFGFRIQQEFPGLVARWYAAQPSGNGVHANGNGAHASHFKQLAERVKGASWKELRRVGRVRSQRVLSRIANGNQSKAERELFAVEVERLRPFGKVLPTLVATPNAPEVVAEIARLSPYYLLTLGGPLLSGALLKTVRGLAINQHAGWSPQLRGSGTIERAIYYRRLDWLGSTVHVMNTAADAGPILRRAHVAVNVDDTPAKCFLRVVGLGTELMIETLHDMERADSVTIFPQPRFGETVRAGDQSELERLAIAIDGLSGWLRRATAKSGRY